jgi:hypothetical protein
MHRIKVRLGVDTGDQAGAYNAETDFFRIVPIS